MPAWLEASTRARVDLVYGQLAVYVGSRLDQDILTDLFLSIGDDQLIVPVVKRGEIEYIVVLVLSDVLAVVDVIAFLDGDDHEFRAGVES